MLKWVESAITFSEFPTEIALCINLSLCPNHCPGCSESYLAGDIGNELTLEVLDNLISTNPGITLVGFMGGDNDPEAICNLVNFVHSKGLKAGMYSGRDYLEMNLLNCLDYYKFGGWRKPEGPIEKWKDKSCGPINLPISNQIMLKKVNNTWLNITDEFRKDIVNDWSKTII